LAADVSYLGGPAPYRHTGAMAAWANSTLVGRNWELARLEERLGQAAAGRGGTVLVAGDAGIGKTRLVSELAARGRAAGAQPLVGRCLDLVGAEVPYLPVAEALRPLLAREDVRRLLGSARELRRLLPGTVAGREPARPGDGAPGSQLGLLEELLALLDTSSAADRSSWFWRTCTGRTARPSTWSPSSPATSASDGCCWSGPTVPRSCRPTIGSAGS
jgi:hypothetical protein